MKKVKPCVVTTIPLEGGTRVARDSIFKIREHSAQIHCEECNGIFLEGEFMVIVVSKSKKQTQLVVFSGPGYDKNCPTCGALCNRPLLFDNFSAAEFEAFFLKEFYDERGCFPPYAILAEVTESKIVQEHVVGRKTK